MIQAKVIADSLSPMGDRLTTLEIVFPRYILAELNTHRLFSKNSASSRAIPFKKMLKEAENNPFIPYAFQRDHSGMQGTEYITDEDEIKEAEAAWLKARDLAVSSARLLNEGLGISKQLANRLLEPFLYHKVLISATEWENFFNLRCPSYLSTDSKETKTFKSRKDWCNYHTGHQVKPETWSILQWLSLNQGQADIHMMFLAEAIYDAIQESAPKTLEEEDWHIPYGDQLDEDELVKVIHKTSGSFSTTLEETRCKISVARCARLSYQTLGDNPVIDYEKDLELYEVLSKSGHFSPFEHVAKVMTELEYYNHMKGEVDMYSITMLEDIEAEKLGWSRNFKGFIQQRALMD